MLTDMMCPPIWDYVMCWNATEAGTTVVQPCPNYIHKFLLNGKIISHLSTKYFTILLNTIKWMLYLSFDRCNDLVNILFKVEIFQSVQHYIIMCCYIYITVRYDLYHPYEYTTQVVEWRTLVLALNLIFSFCNNKICFSLP